jgi:tetratricopeptide (TPR) repeat protein
VPSVDSSGSSDVFDFSFGSAASAPPPIGEPPAFSESVDTGDDFDFSFGIQNETAPPKRSPEPSSSLGNLFDDLEDLPQPKASDAELPAPKSQVDLPGLPDEAPADPIEEIEEIEDSAASLQAPEFTEQSIDETPVVPSAPVATLVSEKKNSGPLYLVLGGMILLGVVCSALYFGGLNDGPTPVVRAVKPVASEADKEKSSAPSVDESDKKSATLAQVVGFMTKLEALEMRIKEEDPSTQVALDTYLALACLQFPDHRYFCANAKSAFSKLKDDDVSAHALGLRLTQNDVKARGLVAKASKVSPQDGLLNMLAGYAAEQVGELEKAVNHFATAYELRPEFAQAIRISTEISIRRGDYEGAEASLSHLEDTIPQSFPSLYLRARLEHEKPQGDVERAMKSLGQAERLPPLLIRKGDLALVYELKAKLLRRDGKLKETISALSKAARLNPANGELLSLLGSIYFERNEYDPALMQIRQLEKDGKTTAELLVLKADCYLRMGQRKKAVAIIDEAKARYPKSASLFLFEGDILTDDRNYKGAEKAYAQAIALRPFDVGIQLKLAKLLMAQSKIEQAKTLLESKLKIDPNSPELLVGYARMRKQLGDMGGGAQDYKASRQHFSQALRQDASDNDVRLEYVDVLIKLNATQAAASELSRVMGAGHLKESVAYLNGRVLAQKGQFEDAYASYEQARSAYDQDPQFFVFMASSAFESKQYDESMKLLDIARLLDNKRSDVYNLLGRTAYQQSMYDLSIRNLKQAIKLDGQHTGHRYWLARAHLRRNETAKARKEFDRIIREVSKNKQLDTIECDSYYLRAQMLREEGSSSWARAVRLLNRHLECAPKHAEAYLLRGKIHADYRSLADARKDFERAASLAAQLKQSRTASQAFYETAKVLKREPRFLRADLIELFSKSVTADASYAPPHRDLCALLSQSEPKRAKVHCKAYLNAAPKGLYASEVRELLRNL